MEVTERLLKYISYDTQSDSNSETMPSTKTQFTLAEVLMKEMEDLGLSGIMLDDYCYLYGCLKATTGMEDVKSVGLIAHMDTAPDYSGKDIKPQIIENYDGKDVLLKGSGETLKVSDFPDLKGHVGKTLITTDGTTLLGADDKAGIAEILTAVEEIINENIPHGDVWIAFTPDEEIGKGASKFNLEYLNADFAYTLDGGYEGELSYENFNAASAEFKVKGKNVHPGSAKGIMINAGAIVSEIHELMPKLNVPEKTEGREGFIMLSEISGNVSQGKAEYIIRDHDIKKFEEKKAFCRGIPDLINKKYGEGTVELNLYDSYYNMYNVMKDNLDVIELGKSAINSIGLEFKSDAIRGGTDGATISNMGLPCPNLGTGGYGFHGPYEHITKEGMENAVDIVKYIVQMSRDINND